MKLPSSYYLTSYTSMVLPEYRSENILNGIVSYLPNYLYIYVVPTFLPLYLNISNTKQEGVFSQSFNYIHKLLPDQNFKRILIRFPSQFLSLASYCTSSFSLHFLLQNSKIMGLRDIGASLPPGFRFYPSDEELVLHYLYKKITNEEVLKGTLVEIDLHTCEPWQLPGIYN